MKSTLHAGVSLLALMVGTNAAMAAPTIFSYTGGFQTYTAPTTGSYTIVAFGAQGGTSNGGNGAEIGGILSLTAGEMLRIAVGGQGGHFSNGGGGGGGSFVIAPGVTPLVIAGGGGGGAANGPAGVGLTGTSGGNSNPAGALGGMGGLGGAGGDPTYGGGGGGGFRGNGGAGEHGSGGNGYPAGLGANYYGGFGGGGPITSLTQPSGGGGGGYSGGAGGYGYAGSGGGGGSFLAAGATNVVKVAGFQTGNGLVSITAPSVAVPEPASLALLGGALGALGLFRRRNR